MYISVHMFLYSIHIMFDCLHLHGTATRGDGEHIWGYRDRRRETGHLYILPFVCFQKSHVPPFTKIGFSKEKIPPRLFQQILSKLVFSYRFHAISDLWLSSSIDKYCQYRQNTAKYSRILQNNVKYCQNSQILSYTAKKQQLIFSSMCRKSHFYVRLMSRSQYHAMMLSLGNFKQTKL